MQTNLVQNFILNQSGPAPKIETPKKPMPEFNIKHELDNRTFIKPLPGNGRLVKSNIFYAPVSMAKSFAYDIKSLKHAIKGEANDHELGKLNDVGMKLGGLAIAYYLFKQKTTPLTKGMEFVGLASFFASMVLWKKIGIQLPAKLIHGVNVDQQYEDSFGRKKPFYLDPQFLPWDLYPDDKINKIGDRLGVPRDIPNRREVIQEKMKKIAVQSNTLWMLTAGFATPVMSGLICRGLEKPLGNFLSNQRNKSADKLLENYDSNWAKFRDTSTLNKLNKFLELNGDKPLTDEIFKQVTSIMTEGIDLVTAKAIKKDLKSKLINDKYLIDDKTVKNLVKNMKEELKGKLEPEVIEQIVPSEKQINRIFKAFEIHGNEFSPEDFDDILRYLQLPIEDNVNKFNKFRNFVSPDTSLVAKDIEASKLKDALTLVDAEDIKTPITQPSKTNIRTLRKMFTPNIPEVKMSQVKGMLIGQEDDLNPIVKALKTGTQSRLDTAAQSTLRDLGNILVDFRAKTALLDKYAYLKAGVAPETVIANFWNDFTDDLTKMLKFSSKEIESARLDRELVSDLLQTKLETVCQNPKEYENFIQKIVQKMAHLQTLIKPSDITNRYNKHVNNTFDEVGQTLTRKNMFHTVDALLGKEYEEGGKKLRNPNGSLKRIQLNYMTQRIEKIQNSLNWFLEYADLVYRNRTGTNTQALHSGLRREMKEEMIVLSEMSLRQGHASDFATKFYFKRNPFPANDFDPVEVKDGKINFKYISNSGVERVDIPQNAEFFDETMKLMFDNPMHPDTEKILKNHAMLDQVKRHRENVIKFIGKDYYFVKPNHIAWGGEAVLSSSQTRYNLLGAAPDQLVFKRIQHTYNSNKWLKMFGKFGIGILSASVLAQFFFGRIKTPQRIQQQKGGN